MNKNTIVKIVLLSVALSFLVNILFGRYLTAKVSTLPLLNRWKIVSPQAPIVINTVRQERVSDTGDILDALNAVKSKLSLVVRMEKDGGVEVLGGAVNVTSDGWFLVPKKFVSTSTLASTYIKVDGSNASMPIERAVLDPATNFAMVKVNASNVAVSPLGSSESLLPGQKIIIARNTLANHTPHFMQSFVTSSQSDVHGVEYSSDIPTRTFGIQNYSQLLPGEVIVNVQGEIIGIWDGTLLISSDVIKNAVSNFINNGQKFIRPQLGIAYRIVTAAESELTKTPQGAMVVAVPTPGSPALKSGLLVNDIIQQVGDVKITESEGLEEIVQNIKPGDTVSLKVSRNAAAQTVTVVVGELK
jgi:hypothetical protein